MSTLGAKALENSQVVDTRRLGSDSVNEWGKCPSASERCIFVQDADLSWQQVFDLLV